MNFNKVESKLKSSQFIRERLLSSEKIKGLVGNNIYPLLAPNTDGEYIIVTRDAYGISSAKTGVYSQSCNVILEVYSNSYDVGLEIAVEIDKLFSTMQDLELNAQIKLKEATEVALEGKYVQVLEYNIG